MTMVSLHATKKELKEAIGSRLHYSETSCFGPEYPVGGTGVVSVVGPSAYQRKYFAQVTLVNGIITKVS